MSNNYASFRPTGGQPQPNGGSFKNGYNGYSQQYQEQAYKKSSGCKKRDSYTHRSGPDAGKTVNLPCITGWKKYRGQSLFTFVAVPAKNAETKNPRWRKFVVKVRQEGREPKITTGFWDVEKKRLRMPDLGLSGMVANPNAPNGGYWGRSGPPRKR